MTTQHMTRDEQIKAVLSAPVPICPSCEHGMDPHGLYTPVTSVTSVTFDEPESHTCHTSHTTPRVEDE